VHLAWRSSKDELKDLSFPMLSDIKRELTTSLGILDAEAGVAQRATYIVDPQGIVRFVYITDLSVFSEIDFCIYPPVDYFSKTIKYFFHILIA
jgi:alkyl hydroperoxide reductase subunit AhpC